MSNKEKIEMLVLRISKKYMAATLEKRIMIGHVLAGDIKLNYEK